MTLFSFLKYRHVSSFIHRFPDPHDRRLRRAEMGHAMDELGRHKTLRGIFQRDDTIVQALDLSSHKGYQTRHRAYDDQVVRWLRNNEAATDEEFLDYLRGLYSTPEMQRRFPQVLETLQGLQP